MSKMIWKFDKLTPFSILRKIVVTSGTVQKSSNSDWHFAGKHK